VGGTEAEAAQFGRRHIPAPRSSVADDPAATDARNALFEEAADFVEVMRRLWDSWEDDAEIRDLATGRFVDREKLHYIDFAGPWFSVRGPSITPRPPQGQPIVAALAHRTVPFRLAARSADVAFVTPQNLGDLSRIVAEIRAAENAVGRQDPPLRIFVDLVVFLDHDASSAVARQARFDAELGEAWHSDAFLFTGTPHDLAEQLSLWHHSEIAGFRLRPAALPDDLESITNDLVPILQDRGLFHSAYTSASMRDLLGLVRPPNRYTPAPVGGA
jgi:alkanesulfonate monooxygenase SsuD/methylene tetrahydromethanopterin reductase-like flavin-dependent oxidoreductase (luciferase family)